MAADPLDPVRHCFAAWDRGDVEGVLAEYSDDAEVDATRVAEGVYSGKDAVRRFYREIVESARFTNEDLRYETHGDQVLAVAQITGTGMRSGAPMRAEFSYLFTVRDGLVRRLVFYPDEESARTALGQASQP